MEEKNGLLARIEALEREKQELKQDFEKQTKASVNNEEKLALEKELRKAEAKIAILAEQAARVGDTTKVRFKKKKKNGYLFFFRQPLRH